MKKSKHIKNPEQEKLRLRVKQLELEKQIKKDWEEIKTGLSSGSRSSGKTESSSRKDEEKGNLLSGVINYGFTVLGKKLSERAGQKTEAAVQQGIEKLTDKIKKVFKK